MGEKIINHNILEGTKESDPSVNCLQNQRLDKALYDLHIIEFFCPVCFVLMDSISLMYTYIRYLSYMIGFPRNPV